MKDGDSVSVEYATVVKDVTGFWENTVEFVSSLSVAQDMNNELNLFNL